MRVERSPTARAVAMMAGVTPATVSRALNPEWRKFQIHRATRERVMAVAKSMGYRSPWSSVDGNRVGLVYGGNWIGCVGIYQDLLRIASEVCTRRGYGLQLISLNDGAASWNHGAMDGLAGCIMTEYAAMDQEAILRQAGCPGVVINWPGASGLPVINFDEAKVIELAMTHLVEQGHRQLIYLVPENDLHPSAVHRWTACMRLAPQFGVQIALAEANPEKLIRQMMSGEIAATACIGQGPLETVELAFALHAAGIAVPTRMSVMSCVDCPILTLFTPKITTVVPPLEAMMEAALDLLFNADLTDRPASQVLLPTLRIRQSTGPVRPAVERSACSVIACV